MINQLFERLNDKRADAKFRERMKAAKLGPDDLLIVNERLSDKSYDWLKRQARMLGFKVTFLEMEPRVVRVNPDNRARMLAAAKKAIEETK